MDREITPGDPMTVESKSLTCDFAVIFEDDGDSGYLYALKLDGRKPIILDAVHIYNVKDLPRAPLSHKISIKWDASGFVIGLWMNECLLAGFDFRRRRGMSRSGFPPESGWSSFGHQWDPELALALSKVV